MRGIVARMLLLLVLLAPSVASASTFGCGRRDRGVAQVALIVTFLVTAGAFVFRRRRIT